MAMVCSHITGLCIPNQAAVKDNEPSQARTAGNSTTLQEDSGKMIAPVQKYFFSVLVLLFSLSG
jgi:hypothetical protein